MSGAVRHAFWGAQGLALLLLFGSAAVSAQDRGPSQKTLTKIAQFTPAQATVGGSVTVDVAVLGEASAPLSGSVLVDAGDGQDCVASLNSSSNPRLAIGSCVISSLTGGVRVVRAQYQGIGGHESSESPPLRYAVGPLPTTLTVVTSGPEPSALGQGFLVSARLDPGVGTPTGSIQFEHASDSCVATLPNPFCVFPSSVSGDIGITAMYSGDALFQPSNSSPRSHQVAPPGPVRRLPATALSGDFSRPDDFLIPTDMSPDGRYVVFESSAGNLLPGPDNNRTDVYRYDRLSKEILRVSVRNDGNPTTTGNSFNGRISADGRYVVFSSDAVDLVAGDTNLTRDVFIRDIVDGSTDRVSVSSGGVQGNGASDFPDIDDGAGIVSFQSVASNLVVGDTNGVADVFYRDFKVSQTFRASVDSLGNEGLLPSTEPVISGDGSSIAFTTANAFDSSNDTNGVADIYVKRLFGGPTLLVSRTTISLGAGDEASRAPSINHDGSAVAYVSAATDLVADDFNGVDDVFVSYVGGSNLPTVRVSLSDGGNEANDSSDRPQISADGFVVAFESPATNLLPGDNNFTTDVFVRDLGGLAGPSTALVSISASSNFASNGGFVPFISGDGRYVSFRSFSLDLVLLPFNQLSSLYLRDRGPGQTFPIGRAATGQQPNGNAMFAAVSADGSVVAVNSEASNLVAGDTNARPDVFVVGDGLPTERVSTTDSGQQLIQGVDLELAISGDGQIVAFASYDSNIVTGMFDANGLGSDVFVINRSIGPSSIELISRSTAGPLQTADANSFSPALSADGRFVVFSSNATDLVTPPVSGTSQHIFLYDRDLAQMELVSVNNGGVELNDSSFDPSISDDGCRVAFYSEASNAGPVNAGGNVYLRIRSGCPGGPSTSLVSQSTVGVPGDNFSTAPRISGNGLAIAFQSSAQNLGGPTLGAGRSYLRRLPPLAASPETLLVSLNPLNQPLDDGSLVVDVDGSGERVVFIADFDGLRPTGGDRVRGPGAGQFQAYMRDLSIGQTVPISLDRFGLPALDGVERVRISADGNKAVLLSFDEQLAAGDANGLADVYIVDLPPAGPGGNDCTWNGSTGPWNDPARWIDCGSGNGNPAGTPGPGDIARIGTGQVSLTAAVTVDQLYLSGGVLTGAEAITVQGVFNWAGGRIDGAGAEAFTMASGSTGVISKLGALQEGDFQLSGRAFIIEGELDIVNSASASGVISLSDGATVVNSGVLRIINSDNSALIFECIGTLPCGDFQNFGTMEITANGGAMSSVQFDANLQSFDNAALVHVLDGCAAINPPGSDGGEYRTEGSCTLAFFTRAGSERIWGDSIVLQQLDSTMLQIGGELRLEGSAIEFGAVQIEPSARIYGPAEIRFNAQTTWRGTIDGDGTGLATIAFPGEVTVDGDSMDPRILRGRTLVNQNVMRIVESDLNLENVPAIENFGFLELLGSSLSGARIRCLGSPDCGVLENKSGGRLESFAMVGGPDNEIAAELSSFLNEGDVVPQTGRLILEPTYSQTDTAYISLAPAGILQRSTPLILLDGVLEGEGTVEADVVNSGAVVSGGVTAGTGTLEIIGDYTQGSSGFLESKIAGALVGVETGLLVVSGTANLDGNLQVVDFGYTPVPPESFSLITAGTGVMGAFASAIIDYGDYELAYAPGEVSLVPISGGGGSFVVNSIGDSGTGGCDVVECTLREAIIEANSSATPAVIEFNIPAGQCTGPLGSCVIAPSSPLPTITNAVLIDGYTQPGAAANTNPAGANLGSNAQIRIELDGSTAGGNGLVLNVGASDLVDVRGLALTGWDTAIVTLGLAESFNFVSGNFIGLRADASLPAQPQATGVRLQGGNLGLGGGAPAARNVISGNSRGVHVIGLLPGSNLTLYGNLIGTAPNGLEARPNLTGIEMETTAVIAGTRIGGNEPDFGNVISGNFGDGILFTCAAVGVPCFDGTMVQGNAIGVAVDRSTELGNGGDGVHLAQMGGGLVTIGGDLPAEANIIAHNALKGIRATAFSGDARASFLRNSIYGNNLIGIDLGGDGRTTNDPGDGDTGPNGLQNFPEVSGFFEYLPGDPATLIIEYLVDSAVESAPSNYPMRVDFYLAEGGQGKVWLGSHQYDELDAQAAVSALVSVPAGVMVAAEDVIVAIATNAQGESSEFSFYGSVTTIISHTPDPSAIGQNYGVAVEVASLLPAVFNVPGDVAVDDGRGGSCLATLLPISPGLSGGSCIMATAGPPGAITLTASYVDAGQAFATSTDSVTHQITGVLATTTSITLIDPSSTVVGQPYAVNVSVLEGGMPVGVGTVRVTQLNDGSQCFIDLATAATSCNLIGFSALNTAVQARYLGSGSFEASNSAVVGHTVDRADTAIEIVSNTPNPSPAGQPITVTVALPVVAPGAGTPGGQVLVTDGIASCAMTLPDLSCELVPKTSGAVVIEARYLGNANYNPSEASVDHVVVADGADLSIIKRNGLRLLPGGIPSTYVILVSNAGPQDVFNARVTDILPPQLGNANWTCSGSNGGTCPASGSGNVDVLVNLPSGASVTFLLTVTAQIQPEQIVSNIASVIPPANAEDPNLANNVSVDTDPIGIFGDGHETEDE